uniref:Dienelactone hydrolase domain-containing protein n=1 Tax=Arion vulgaris TaxID=1028688 RepID=A0A0B7AM63_9EUPU
MKPVTSLFCKTLTSHYCRQLAFNRLYVIAKQLSTMSSSKRVNCPSENKLGECPAFLNGDPKTVHKAIIVIQEWWGVNQQIQDCARDIAKDANVITLVPDLYRGKVATDHETAGHYMDDLDWGGAVGDIRGCARYLKSLGCKKVGVTGFCMGGALSMAAAALVSEIDAVAPFYGIPGEALCDVTTIKVPLQCHFAEKDETFGFASPAEWKPLKTKLEGSVKQLEFYIYDAGHAFNNKTGPNYNEELSKLAFSRMFDFFQKNLS